jgi:hypothetical protein
VDLAENSFGGVCGIPAGSSSSSSPAAAYDGRVLRLTHRTGWGTGGKSEEAEEGEGGFLVEGGGGEDEVEGGGEDIARDLWMLAVTRCVSEIRSNFPSSFPHRKNPVPLPVMIRVGFASVSKIPSSLGSNETFVPIAGQVLSLLRGIISN